MSGRLNKFYLFLFLLCAAGYIYLYISFETLKGNNHDQGLCLVKKVAHIPCPSCGSTRAVVAIMQGEFNAAIHINPMGYVVAGFMIILPLWIISDKISKKQTLYNVYRKTEKVLKKPALYIPIIFIVLLNWLWNINKAL